MSTLVETHLPDSRKATCSLQKLLKSLIKVFTNTFEAFVEARRMQAAYQTATQLRMHNEDFKKMSHSEIVQWILNKDNT
jgi:hypothetical protein